MRSRVIIYNLFFLCCSLSCMANAANADCYTISACKKNIEDAINQNVSRLEANNWVEKYESEMRRTESDTHGISYSTDLIDKNMSIIEADYDKLNQLRTYYYNKVNSICGGIETDECRDARENLHNADAAITELDKKANEVFFSRNVENGYVWLAQDDDKLIRMQGIIDRTIEKNKKIVEQKEEIDRVIKLLGRGNRGISISQHPTVSANIKSRVCTDPLLTSADESAAKAASVYGEMLLPAKYPSAGENKKLLNSMIEDTYRNELAYSLAISTFNINRIANKTDSKIADLSKDVIESSGTEADALALNSDIVATISSEIIPLIVNIASTITLESIGAVRTIPKNDVNIE